MKTIITVKFTKAVMNMMCCCMQVMHMAGFRVCNCP